MRRLGFSGVRLLLLFFLAGTALQPKMRASDEVNVWAVASNRQMVYHCPGSKWYGVGDGKVMGECQAIRERYQPAMGHGCGSTC